MPLASFVRAFARSGDVAYVITRERRLVRTNDAWARFASANGGDEIPKRWTRGASIDDAMTPDARPFYLHAYARALSTGERWEHDYDCSSPERLRRFRMIAYPLYGEFLAITHSRIVDLPAFRSPDDDGRAPTYELDGVVTMCSECRRVRRPPRLPSTAAPNVGERWDVVPRYLAVTPPNLSHGMCAPCFIFYGRPAGAR